MKKRLLTAEDITEALRRKHEKDVFISQCKTGPTWLANGSLGIIDALAIKKTWKELIVIGYEIKVSRSDFLNDDKYKRYLDYTTDMYFACTWKLIQPDEIPPEFGLVWVTNTGNRVVVKKKAPRRAIDLDCFSLIARYILYSRAMFSDHEVISKVERRRYYERIVQEAERGKATANRLARFANRALARENTRLWEDLWRARREADEAKREAEANRRAGNVDPLLSRVVKKLSDKIDSERRFHHLSSKSLEDVLVSALAIQLVSTENEDKC